MATSFSSFRNGEQNNHTYRADDFRKIRFSSQSRPVLETENTTLLLCLYVFEENRTGMTFKKQGERRGYIYPKAFCTPLVANLLIQADYTKVSELLFPMA
jgi:hypothetical protein